MSDLPSSAEAAGSTDPRQGRTPEALGEPVAQRFEPAVVTPVEAEVDLGEYPTGQLLRLHEDELAPTAPAVDVPYAQIAFGLGVLGMVGGLFVAWAFPASLGAVVFGVLARRRAAPHWMTRVGLWTGVAGLFFGGVWLLYYLTLLAT